MDDSRFSHISGDLRFKPLKSKERRTDNDGDERLSKLRQHTSLKTIKDPRGNSFDIRKLGLQTQKVPKRKVDSESDTDSNEENDEQESSSEDETDKDIETGNNTSDNEEKQDYVDVEEDFDLVEKMNQDMMSSSKVDDRYKKVICNPEYDHARGLDAFSDVQSSSDDEWSSDEDDEIVHPWGEEDKDAKWNSADFEVEETSRLGVCNLNWDLFKAPDIMMVLASFVPRGGSVKKVAVYKSEYGKTQLAIQQEQLTSSKIKKSKKYSKNDDGEEEVNHDEARDYHFDKLKHYYAVAECDSAPTACAICTLVDRTSFSNGAIVDLRFIPSDMTFDDIPISETTIVPKDFVDRTTTKLFLSENLAKPQTSWEDDDLSRAPALQNLVDNVTKMKQEDFDRFIAPVLSDSEDLDVGGEEYACEYESVAPRDNVDLYRELMATVAGNTTEKPNKQKVKGIQDSDDEEDGDGDDNGEESDMSSDNDEEQEADDNKEDKYSNLTPHEKYLAKKKDKLKAKRRAKKAQAGVTKKPRDDDDRDIPDDIKNDPFFKEELDKRRKDKLRIAREKRLEEDKYLAELECAKDKREKEIALLMMKDDKMAHFDAREEVRQHAAEGSAKKGKLSRWKMTKLKAKEKRLARQGVILSTPDALETKIAPTRQRSAKEAMAGRFSDLLVDAECNLDPTRPMFVKYHTPFLEELGSEMRKEKVARPNKKKMRLNSSDETIAQ